MPKNQSTLARMMRQSFVVVIAISILFSACKSDKKGLNTKEAFDGPDVVNFLINGKEKPGKDQIPLDITLLQYEENKQNEEHVMYVPILDSVYLQDVSRFNDGAPGERQWYVDGELLPSNAKEVAYFTELPGPSKVILKFTDYINVSKGVFFTDGVDYTDELAGVPDEDDSYEQVGSNSDPSPVSEPAASNNNSYSQPKPAASTYNPPKPKPSSTVAKASSPPPAPPKRVEIENVDFSVSKTTVETGEKMLFRDLSSPAAAVKNRVWDWGDGVTTPTKGSTFGYSYSRPGTYTVKLCLNYSSKCATKQITVKKAADPVIVATAPPKAEAKKEEKKPEVSRVAISGPSSSIVGKPIEIVDDSYPQSAVSSREWFINGVKENYAISKFSKTFDQPGNYTIKLCVNGDMASCESKVITIEKKPEPKPAKKEEVAAGGSYEEFFAMAASRTGLRTSQRCPEDEIKWSTGAAELTLTPTVPMELMNARIFGKKVALAKVTLKSSDGKVNKVINNVQILPGPSSVEFGDFAVVLRPGTKYVLTIEPMPGAAMELEDGGGCNTNFAADDRLSVSYKDNVMTLYNIKFGY